MNKSTYNVVNGEYVDLKNAREYIETGIGLQLVDNLKPSQELYKVTEKIISGELNYKEAEIQITSYHNSYIQPNLSEKEADIVSLRIAQCLNNRDFRLTISTLLDIHKTLFEGVFEFPLDKYVGKIRDLNISKKEPILNGATVYYTDYSKIKEYLEYDLEQERLDRIRINDDKKFITPKHLVDFTSRIWNTHPFRERNTRTTAVFIEKYLRSFGVEVNNDSFKEHSQYFRDALVLASDNELGITNYSYLEDFFEKLINNANLELRKIEIKSK